MYERLNAIHLLRLAGRLSCLSVAAIQLGCALPSGGQSALAVLSAPFAGAAQQPQTPADSCVAAAHKLERKGQVRPAIAKFEEARQLNPAAPVAHSLALLCNRDGNVERARAEFALAIQASPRDPELLTDMGCFAFEHGNYAEAEKLLRQSLDLKPGDERAWVVLGLSLGKQNRYEESFDAFARILSRDENRAAQESLAIHEETAADQSVKSSKNTLANLQLEAAKLSKVESTTAAHTP
jgi:tetratricopeptide (TPR) repeat protein